MSPLTIGISAVGTVCALVMLIFTLTRFRTTSVDERLRAAIQVERDARHKDVNQIHGEIARVERDQRELAREAVRRADMEATERRLVSEIGRIDTRIENHGGKLDQVLLMQGAIGEMKSTLERLVARGG